MYNWKDVILLSISIFLTLYVVRIKYFYFFLKYLKIRFYLKQKQLSETLFRIWKQKLEESDTNSINIDELK